MAVFAITRFIALPGAAGTTAAVASFKSGQAFRCAAAALDDPSTVYQPQTQAQNAQRDDDKTENKFNHDD